MKTKINIVEDGLTISDVGFFIAIFICLMVMYCLAGQLDNAIITGQL